MYFTADSNVRGAQANLVDNDRELLVNRVIGLRLIEEHESIFK